MKHRWAAIVLVLWLAATAAYAQDDSGFTVDTYEFAQRYTLQLVNRERGLAGVGRVSLDPVASQVAKQHAEDMLAGGYFSHWNRQGLKPTRRYNLAGGYNTLGENVYYEHGFDGDLEARLTKMVETLLDSPGHRRTILDPNYTHVGLGFALSADGRKLYASQEFIVRIGGEYSCPLRARHGAEVEFRGRFDRQLYELDKILVGYEDPPEPREVSWLMRTESYQDGGKIFAGYLLDPSIYMEGLESYYTVQVDPQTGRYSCRVRLNYKDRPGLYYIMVWLDEKATGEPILAATATIVTEN
ncbi:CAP domain-containing protein [bacterium]|nr:CAP domain-containing protein [bacterium]